MIKMRCPSCKVYCCSQRELRDDEHQVHQVWCVCAYCGRDELEFYDDGTQVIDAEARRRQP